MYRAYWTGSGLSRLYWASTWASCSGVSFSAFWMGEPGKSCMRNQVVVAMMNSTTKAFTRRLSVYFSMPPPQRVPERGGRAGAQKGRRSPPDKTSSSPSQWAVRLLALDARVLVVVAPKGVRRVALEVRLLHAGDRIKEHGDRPGLLDQTPLGLEHHLHALVDIRLRLGAFDEPVVLLVLEKRVVERRVREVEVEERHRIVVVPDPAEGVVDLVVFLVHPIES